MNADKMNREVGILIRNLEAQITSAERRVRDNDMKIRMLEAQKKGAEGALKTAEQKLRQITEDIERRQKENEDFKKQTEAIRRQLGEISKK